MPNTIAYIVLYSWPVITIILFRKLPLREALIWTIVLGYIVLPVGTGFNLPVLPTVDKFLIPPVAAAIMCFLTLKRIKSERIRQARRAPAGSDRDAADPALESDEDVTRFAVKRGQVLFWSLIALMFTSPFLTALQNAEPVVIGTRTLQGMKIYDAFSICSGLLVTMIPFLLGRRFLATPDSRALLLRILAAAAFFYSFLILYEIRMSPQLNSDIYGFFPHSWRQHLRGDGYRPLVFFHHGLVLAIFVAMSTIAAFAYWRHKAGDDAAKKWLLAGLWLFGVLFLSRSLGAFLLVFLFCPVVVFLPRRAQIVVAAAFAGIILLYPALRGAGLVPVGAIHSLAQSIDTDRADSLMTRFENEDILLARANEKPLAGWGSWGRPRVYNEAGKDISITDGYWVIVVGQGGWLGYVALFGLLCLPLVLLGLNSRRMQPDFATSGLSVVLCVGLIDQLPNATIGPIIWLIAGAMMGGYQSAEWQAEAVAAPGRAGARPVARSRPRNTAVANDIQSHARAGGGAPHKRTSR